MNELTDSELKELKEKAQAWDIAWPALIFLDALGNLRGSMAHDTLARAVEVYNDNRKTE